MQPCSLKCFLEGGGGGVDIYMSKFVSHIHNCYQTDQYETEDSPKNRLIGYIHVVTLIHSDKLLWENVINYATLYSLKCLFETKIGLTHP